MASNLSTIGFAFDNEDSFRHEMVQRASAAADFITCAPGQYGIWKSRSGAEIWFHLGRNEAGEIEIFGLSPYFEGKSEIAVNVTGPVRRDGDNPFEGALHAWAVPDANPDPKGEGSYPLVFDAVDFAVHSETVWPALKQARIAGFARELKTFASDAAYYASLAGGDQPQLSAQAFIPIGLFTQASAAAETGQGDPTPPASTALLTGRVIEHRRLTNEATGCAFDWLLVETLDMTIDVLADPAIVTGGIAEGGTIEAAVYLFGRLLD